MKKLDQRTITIAALVLVALVLLAGWYYYQRTAKTVELPNGAWVKDEGPFPAPFGTVTRVGEESFTFRGRGNVEETYFFAPETAVYRGGAPFGKEALAVGSIVSIRTSRASVEGRVALLVEIVPSPGL